jgi:hypothetical protein
MIIKHEYYEDDFDGYEASIKRIEELALCRRAEAEGYEKLCETMKEDYIDRICAKRKIWYGDVVVMDFDEGREDVIYDGARFGTLYVYHFTTKGKQCKNPTPYKYDYAHLMTLKETK